MGMEKEGKRLYSQDCNGDTVRDCLHSTGVATLLLNNYLSSSGVVTLLGTVLRFRDSNPT